MQKKLSFWPSEVALPFIPAPCSGVVRTSCLGVCFAELEMNALPALDSSCDVDDSVVWKSHCDFKLALTRKSIPCRGTFARANQAGRCIN